MLVQNFCIVNPYPIKGCDCPRIKSILSLDIKLDYIKLLFKFPIMCGTT